MARDLDAKGFKQMRPATDSSCSATSSATEDVSDFDPANIVEPPASQAGALDAGELVRLVKMFVQAPAFMAVVRGPDHRFEFVNAAYFQLVGHRDVNAKSVLEAFPELREQGFIGLLDQVYQTGVEFVGDETPVMLQRTPGPSLELRYVNFVFQPIRDDSGAVNGIFAHGVDVTDLVLARQRSDKLASTIEQQARSYGAMLSSIKDFVYCFDLSGRFTYANDSLLELLGLAQDQIAGKSFYDLPYSTALANALHDNIARVIATGKTLRDETEYTNPARSIGPL